MTRTTIRSVAAITLAAALSLLGLASAVASPEEDYASACELLESGDHSAARDALQEIVKNEHYAAEVFFQLGNANFRLEEPGLAALSYHRALYLDPGHRESAQNLAFVEKRLGSISTDAHKTPEFVRKLPDRQLSRALTLGLWLIALALATFIAFRARKPGLTAVAIALLIAGVCLSAASAWAAHGKDATRPNSETAIVIAEGAVARTAPATSASEVVSLPQGSEISIVAERGAWVYVDLPDELRAWLPAASTERLWPYDSGFSG